MRVSDAVDRCLGRLEEIHSGRSMVVAFSGGADSTALLHALAAASARHRISVHAAHLDHAIDAASELRCRRALEIARQLGVAATAVRRSALDARRSGESLEAAARRIRYEFLEETAGRLGAAWIATAHHADDQRETVLLRLLFGSGLAGLRGIPVSRGPIIRPLLGVERAEIERYLSSKRLEAIDDPSNLDLRIPRNLVRHRLLPALRAEDPRVDSQLLSLSRTAEAAVVRADRLLEAHLDPETRDGSIRFRRSRFERLSPELRSYALGTLGRMIGAPPPASAALAGMNRQIIASQRLGCDLGSGWRLDEDGSDLVLHQPRACPRPFAYTLKVPGEIRLPELSLIFRLTERPVESWMFRGSQRRAGMSLSLGKGDEVTIRSRRPGDRLQPLGCDYSRRLKEILIDRKMPQQERDRLPLLCVGERIVWVPGVTIDESVRLREGQRAWVAEIEDVQESLK